MTIKGDTAGLRWLQKDLEKLSKEGMRELSANLAEESLELIRQGFDQSRDPYGKRWEPTKRGGQILRESGRLRNSFTTANITAQGFRVGSNAKQVALQNYGGTVTPKSKKFLRFRTAKNERSKGGFVFARKVVIPARPMIPDERGLPSSWEKSLTEAAQEVIDEILQSE